MPLKRGVSLSETTIVAFPTVPLLQQAGILYRRPLRVSKWRTKSIFHIWAKRGAHANTYTHSSWASAGHTYTTADFHHIQSLGEGKEHRFVSETITESRSIRSRETAQCQDSVAFKRCSQKAAQVLDPLGLSFLCMRFEFQGYWRFQQVKFKTLRDNFKTIMNAI